MRYDWNSFKEYSNMPPEELEEVMRKNLPYVERRMMIRGRFIRRTLRNLGVAVTTSLVAKLFGAEDLVSQINQVTLYAMISVGAMAGCSELVYRFTKDYSRATSYWMARDIWKRMRDEN